MNKCKGLTTFPDTLSPSFRPCLHKRVGRHAVTHIGEAWKVAENVGPGWIILPGCYGTEQRATEEMHKLTV